MMCAAFQPHARAADTKSCAGRVCGASLPALRISTSRANQGSTSAAAGGICAARQQRRRGRQAAAAADGGAAQHPLQLDLWLPLDEWEEALISALEDEGWQVAGDPLLVGCVRRAGGLASCLVNCGTQLALALQLALAVCRLDAAAAFSSSSEAASSEIDSSREIDSSSSSSSGGAAGSSIAALTMAKFELFRCEHGLASFSRRSTLPAARSCTIFAHACSCTPRLTASLVIPPSPSPHPAADG